MTPPRSLVGTLAGRGGRWRWLRRLLVVGLTVLFALLALFPEKYRAAVTMTPTDPTSFGLSGALNQLGAANSVFGNQAAVEIALKVAHSLDVRQTVAAKLDLSHRLGKNAADTDRWLQGSVDVRSLRGGIIQMEHLDRDATFARDLISAYAYATRDRLAQINRAQTAYKREILLKLVADAGNKLAEVQGRYDRFRLKTRYGEPAIAIQAVGERIPTLEAALKAKAVQLNAARQFATDSNMNVREINAQIAALQQQLNEARATDPSRESSVGRVVEQSTEAIRLQRELLVARTLYESYVRFLEGTSVEDLTSSASMRFLEPPYIDDQRQINIMYAIAAVLVLLVGAAIEFYELRPPVGDRSLVPA